MADDIYAILLMIVIVITACVGAFYVRNLLTKRALSKVLTRFRQRNAVGMESARTLRELGLEPPSFVKKATGPRDYKQQALQILIKQGTVRVRADGKVYIVEENPDQN